MSAYTYAAFGYCVIADRELAFCPWQPQWSAVGDLSLRVVDALPWSADDGWALLHEIEDYDGGPWLRLWHQGDRLLMRYAGWSACWMRGAGEVLIVASDVTAVAFEHVAERVWVPLYAMWSHPEWLALHGSAVGLDGRALVLVGPSGAGKSTTAHALYQRGATLISDDMVLVDPVDGIVYGAAPTLRLWQTGPIEGAQRAEAISPVTSKRWLAMRVLNWLPSWQLGAIMVLTRDRRAPPEGAVVAVSKMDATIELLRNGFGWACPTPDMKLQRMGAARALVNASYGVHRLMFSPSSDQTPRHIEALPQWVCP